MHRHRVGRLEELGPGQVKLVEVEGARIVVARVGDTVYACGDVCAHRGGPLSDGRLTGTRLACPWHGWMYDVTTGQCLMPSRGGHVPTYRAGVDAGEIWLEIGG